MLCEAKDCIRVADGAKVSNVDTFDRYKLYEVLKVQ